MKDIRQKGFSLLEVTVASVLLVVLVGASVSAIQSSRTASAAGVSRIVLLDRARSAMDRIEKELRRGGPGTLDPALAVLEGNPGSRIEFSQAENYANGAVVWGFPVIFDLVYANGEIDNGLDDNNDGLVDEMEITREQNGQTITLVTDVQENGLSFTASGNSLTINLTLQGRDQNGQILTLPMTTTVQLRVFE